MKKILIVIDDERREIEAEYFDLTISSGIGEGYDAIFAVSTKKEEIVLEGQVEHPTKNSVLSESLPQSMTFSTIGLSDDLKMQRNVSGIDLSTPLPPDVLTEKAIYKIDEAYNIQVPGVLHSAVTDLVSWEKVTSQGRPFRVVQEPLITFTDDSKTKFIVTETIQIQTGVVEKA